MAKKHVWKGVTAAVAAVATSLAMSSVSMSPAYAKTGGGRGGGGGSGNTASGYFQWRSVRTAIPGQAYRDFTAQARWHHVDQMVASTVPHSQGAAFLATCKSSQTIWYLYNQGLHAWVHNYSGPTHGSGWRGRNSIENPSNYTGLKPNAGEVQEFKNWDAVRNGHQIDATPGYVIICSGAFDGTSGQPDKTSTTRTPMPPETSKKDMTVTRPYSYQTTVAPQISGSPVHRLHPQSGPPTTTAFGDVWNALAKNPNASESDVMKQVADAQKRDAQAKHATISLDPVNKAGMADGGVLNVYEQTRWASLHLSTTTTIPRTRVCTYVQKWNSRTNSYDPATLKGCTVEKGKPSKQTLTNTTVGTLDNTGFWQMIAAHCNKAGVEALRRANGGDFTEVPTGDKGGISFSATTRKFDAQPAHLPFGDANNPDKAKAATGVVGFFDKECPYTCTSHGPGASAANGATANTPPSGKGRYGALMATKDGRVNDNVFRVFRDNKPHRFDINTWFPVSGGVVSYHGQAPVTTTVIRWSEGTPGVGTHDGGTFTMKDEHGRTMFTGSEASPAQHDWNVAPFSNDHAQQMLGLHRTFTVASTWASDVNHPQVLNTKWEYRPTVTTKFPTTGIGFGENGVKAPGVPGVGAAAIEGRCYANFGTPKPYDVSSQMSGSTGTGSVNTLDSGQPIQGTADGHNANTLQTNLMIPFVRATAS